MQLEDTPATPDDLTALALYNYGHFTSMRLEAGRVRGLSLHLERLTHDSERLFGQSIDPERARELIRNAVHAADHEAAIVRVTVFAPDLDMSHPGRNVDPKIMVTTRPAPARLQKPARIMASRYSRDLPSVKHVGLFGSIEQRRNAQLAGYDDVLFMDGDSVISEGATWNVGFVKDRRIIWPKSEALAGVTLRVIQGHLERVGIETVTEPVFHDSLGEMDAAFMTNAATGVRAIAVIDGTRFKPESDVLTQLRELYWSDSGEEL